MKSNQLLFFCALFFNPVWSWSFWPADTKPEKNDKIDQTSLSDPSGNSKTLHTTTIENQNSQFNDVNIKIDSNAETDNSSVIDSTSRTRGFLETQYYKFDHHRLYNAKNDAKDFLERYTENMQIIANSDATRNSCSMETQQVCNIMSDNNELKYNKDTINKTKTKGLLFDFEKADKIFEITEK